MSWMSRAMTSCPMAEPTLSSQMPGAKSFTESAMIVPTFGQISSGEVRELIFVPSRINE